MQTQTFLGGELAALVWGNPGHQVWLALHGWLDNAASFSRLAPLLAERLKVCIVAPDLPGHGQSVHRSHEMDYAPWGYAGDVLSIIEELSTDRVTLLGHSMGAIIANVFAAAFPERVNRLVLLDGMAGLLMTPDVTPAQLRAGILARREQQNLQAREFPSIEAAIQVRVRKSVLPISREAAEPIIRRNLRLVADNGRVMLTTDEKLKQPRTLLFTEQQVLAVLTAISAPALLITCADGSVLQRDPNRQFRNAVAQLTEVSVPGGHHAHAEAVGAERICQAITDYVDTSNE